MNIINNGIIHILWDAYNITIALDTVSPIKLIWSIYIVYLHLNTILLLTTILYLLITQLNLKWILCFGFMNLWWWRHLNLLFSQNIHTLIGYINNIITWLMHLCLLFYHWNWFSGLSLIISRHHRDVIIWNTLLILELHFILLNYFDAGYLINGICFLHLMVSIPRIKLNSLQITIILIGLET